MKELIIKVDEEKMDIEGNAPVVDRPQELVRCKDCKYRFVDGDNVRFNMCLLNHNKVQPDDWFCADGERKEIK